MKVKNAQEEDKKRLLEFVGGVQICGYLNNEVELKEEIC
jgi:hypothetical protein